MLLLLLNQIRVKWFPHRKFTEFYFWSHHSTPSSQHTTAAHTTTLENWKTPSKMFVEAEIRRKANERQKRGWLRNPEKLMDDGNRKMRRINWIKFFEVIKVSFFILRRIWVIELWIMMIFTIQGLSFSVQCSSFKVCWVKITRIFVDWIHNSSLLFFSSFFCQLTQQKLFLARHNFISIWIENKFNLAFFFNSRRIDCRRSSILSFFCSTSHSFTRSERHKLYWFT